MKWDVLFFLLSLLEPILVTHENMIKNTRFAQIRGKLKFSFINPVFGLPRIFVGTKTNVFTYCISKESCPFAYSEYENWTILL